MNYVLALFLPPLSILLTGRWVVAIVTFLIWIPAVIFSGGVSAGAYEVVKTSLAGAMEFTKIAMQPGEPQGFGATDDGVLLFGLAAGPIAGSGPRQRYAKLEIRYRKRRTGPA